MTSTYTIPAVVKDELQKKLEKLNKKARTYGNHLEWSFSEEFVANRNVYSVDPVTQTQVKTGDQKVFCVEITIDSDIIKKDGYTVVAQIEHLESGNVVNMIDESVSTDLNWYTMTPFCEHCNSRHVKRFTFMVMDESGHFKQVGKTCLKDYCGIDPQMIAMNQELTDLILNDYNIDNFEFSGSGEYGYDILDVIATANDIITMHGYVKSSENMSTKSRLLHDFGTWEPSKKSRDLALEMQDELSKIDYDELSDFLRNVKSMIQSKYVRSNVFGYIAYAPVAYENLKKQREQEQRRNEAKAQSSYIGNIGDRITVPVKESKLITSYGTAYGWTYIYKFLTGDNNVLVWFSSRYIEGEPTEIVGTIKDHKEYNGEKQTVLTRCKVTKVKPEETPAELDSAVNVSFELFFAGVGE